MMRAGHWLSGWPPTVRSCWMSWPNWPPGVRVYSCGHDRKTDKDDAVSVGLAALDGTCITPVTRDGAPVSLRLVSLPLARTMHL